VTGRRSRAVRGVRVVLAVFVAASLIEAGAPAQAQDVALAPALGGLQGRAAASGVHVGYSPEGILPIPNLLDLGAPDALATIASGPTTFARASVLDPGDILANPDAVLALAAGSSYPAGSIPPYPYRITANSGTGDPPAESAPAPGLAARVRAERNGSEARAAVGETAAPAILHLGSARSEATTETDGGTVTVHARAQVGDLNLLGLLTIDALVTDVTATSDGTTTEVEGGTTITGASVLGTPVTIDADGIHAAGNGSGTLRELLDPVVGTVNDVLAAAGLTVTLAGPVDLGEGATGQRLTTGLRIGLDFSKDTVPELTALLDALPPIDNPIPGAPGIEDLLVVARAHQIGSVEVGRALVSLTARPARAADGAVPSTGGGTPSAGTPSFTPGALGLPPVSPVAPSQPGGRSVPTGSTSELPRGAGIGGLVLLALLSAPFVGDRLGGMAQGILGARGAATCPREGP
jgi:hypothetical protein